MTNWNLTEAVPLDRRKRLLSGLAFEEIALEICNTCTVHKPVTQWTQRTKEGRRPIFCLSVPQGSHLVDHFHNGADGYRARYLSSVERGENANGLVMNLLRPLLELAWEDWLHRPHNLDWLRSSLSQNGKIWIHQGRWSLRWNLYRLPRELIVESWAANLQSSQSEVRKKVRLGMLCPYEHHLVVKGVFLDEGGCPIIKKSSASRAEQINKYGFT